MKVNNDYMKFRGKCKEMSEELCAKDPSLRLVRGHYYCPYWGEQEHWWTEDKNGEIIDPTKNQFPSKGIGEYIEFDGTCTCSECGKRGKEEEFSFESNYQFCSSNCHLRFVGLEEYCKCLKSKR